MYQLSFDSLLGKLWLVASDHGLSAVLWDNPAYAEAPPESKADHHLREARLQLEAFLAGQCQTFDLVLAPSGSEFQTQVWRALRQIPYGETRSYRDIAESLDRPGASRAIGHANARNPLCIIVPCHRVIAHDGTLGGYSGGLDRKRALLDLEASHPS